MVSVEPARADVALVRGEINGDGAVSLSDPRFLLKFLFLGGPAPACHDVADANDDGALDISDPIATIRSLYLGLDSIAPPYPEPGYDPTEDALGPCLSK